MAKKTNLRELLIDQLQDRYSAARQQKEEYPKLIDATDDSELKQLIQKDMDRNDSHMNMLKSIFDRVDANPMGEYCEGTAALIKEAVGVIDMFEQGAVLDAAIALSIQHINHHDISGFNACVLLAKHLKNSDIEKDCRKMLDEEEANVKSLSKFIDRVLS